MSTLTLLPLVRVSDGVQTNEDWRLAIAFYLDDGVTPVNLDGLSFSLEVGAFATLSTGSGQISVAGPLGNVLNIAVLAENKSGWPVGVHPLSLTASDGVSTKDVFARSTLAVGSPQTPRVSLVVAPDTTPRALASALPAALAQALQSLQPGNVALALAGLPAGQLVPLAQALVASFAVQTGAGAPVNTGEAFVNSSGYVVIAQ